MSSTVETSLKRFLHSLRSVEMTVGVNMYIVPKSKYNGGVEGNTPIGNTALFHQSKSDPATVQIDRNNRHLYLLMKFQYL